MSLARVHTPGPWRAGKVGDAVVADVSVDGGPLGSDAFEHYGGNLIAESVAPCNRPLIVAAPELLQVLKAIVAFDQIDARGKRYSFDYNSPLAKQVRAVIVKAEEGTAA